MASSLTIAAPPTTTIRPRSDPGREPAAVGGADLAADHRAGRDQRRRGPGDVGGEGEDHPGDPVGEAGEHVLQPVRPLQALGQGDAEDAEQEDALGGAEVAAVDPGREDRERGEDPVLVGDPRFAPGQRPVDPGLEDDEDQRR